MYLTQFLPGKLIFYGIVLKSIACVALVCEAAVEISIRFLIFRKKEINEFVVTSNDLNNSAGLVTSGLGLYVARGPPV